MKVFLAVLCSMFGLAAISFQDIAYANPPQPIYGSATYDPPSTATSLQFTTTVTVNGALLGDFCMASFSLDVTGVGLTCQVTAANVATVTGINNSNGTINLASGTLRVAVIPQPH